MSPTAMRWSWAWDDIAGFMRRRGDGAPDVSPTRRPGTGGRWGTCGVIIGRAGPLVRCRAVGLPELGRRTQGAAGKTNGLDGAIQPAGPVVPAWG